MPRTPALTAILIILGCSILAAAPPQPVMPAREVRRGMTGYGLSVFQGMQVERFSVEVLGVLYNSGAKSDLILAKLSGGPLAETGVIAGMSGSPVYIDGKLVGAVAYAWGFAKSAIAGITPMEEMLEVFKFREADTPPRFRLEPKGPTELHGQPIAWQGAAFRTVATPLVMAGINPALFPELSKPFEEMGFLPVLGGNAGADATTGEAAERFAPGSAIGVQLVSGDISMTGIGTVSYVGEEGILAFGHPMMMRGASSFPMTTAYIHTVMPSRQISFKLGSAVRTIGSIHQDRQAAIAGRYGVPAQTVPVKMAFSLAGNRKEYSFSVVRDEQLFARLFASLMMNTLVQNSANFGRTSSRIEYRFTLRDTASGRLHEIVTRDSYASFQSAYTYYQNVLGMIGKMLEALYNQYRTVSLEAVTVSIEGIPEVQAIEISELRSEKRRVRPGETLALSVKLTPWRGVPFWEKISVTVPKNVQNGRIFFVVSSSADERYYDQFFSPLKYQAESLDDLVRLLNIDRNAADLVVWSELFQSGLVVEGRELPNLPSSVFRQYAESQIGRMGTLNARLRRTYPSNYFLYGLQLLQLEMDYSTSD